MTSTPIHRTGRLPAALAAILAAAAAGAGAFAPPAAAQTPVPTDVTLDLDNPQVPGDPPRQASLDVAFDEDPTGSLLMRLDVDAPDATIYFGNGPGCDSPDNTPYIECENADPGTANTFTFSIAAATGTELGDYDYTLTILLDGAEIHSETGVIDVVEDRYDGVFRDYDHEIVSVTGVEPGTVVEASPRIRQNSALPDDIVALAAHIGGSVAPGTPIEGAFPQVPWDNCTIDIVMSGSGYFCVFTEFEDLPGTVLEFSEPLRYQVAENLPGPLEACGCGYSLWAVNQEVLDRDFGGPWWDPASTNLLTVETAGDQGDPDPAETGYGSVDIETVAASFDLSVEGANLSGSEAEATVPVANGGPANAPNRALGEEEPAYQLRGQLPEGAELVAVEIPEEGHWFCADEGDLAALYEAAADDTELDRFDFVCHFWSLESGEAVDVALTIDLADATGEPGRVEIDALYRGVDGVNLDGDLSNNSAALTVDGSSLPNTGNSTITFVAVAAGALVLGIVLFLVTRRRNDPDESADAAASTEASGSSDSGAADAPDSSGSSGSSDAPDSPGASDGPDSSGAPGSTTSSD
jgi:LPXTG-motif cell wall-anchored protein